MEQLSAMKFAMSFMDMRFLVIQKKIINSWREGSKIELGYFKSTFLNLFVTVHKDYELTNVKKIKKNSTNPCLYMNPLLCPSNTYVDWVFRRSHLW